MKILICEDEKPASRHLVRLIQKVRKDAEIVAQVDKAHTALQLLDEIKPDLIFMDVELADGPCFETLRDTEIQYPLVFTTAYDEYALKAFKLNSIDYLLKPISEVSIERTFRKYDNLKSTFTKRGEEKNQSMAEEYDIEEKIESILEKKLSKTGSVNRLSVKQNGTIRLINISDIQWVESDGNYVHIHTEKKKFFMRSTLSGFLKQLDPDKFYQIHKSLILNIDFLDYIEQAERGDYIVVLMNGERLKMSRNFRDMLDSV